MISLTDGLLVVRRLNPATEYPTYDRSRVLPLGLTHDDVLRRYRGFEGEAWPSRQPLLISTSRNDLAPMDQYEAAMAYYQVVSRKHRCDFLYLFPSPGHSHPPRIPGEFSFCGFDFGGYYSRYNHYSVVFNEIIYGVTHDALKAYARFLNADLLLPSLQLAMDLGDILSELRSKGAPLESFASEELLMPIAVYGIQ